MDGEHEISGALGRCDEPDWQPLLDLVGAELTGWFMWMCAIELEDGTRLHAYKHRCTRRYVHLATDGRAYAYAPRSRYREIDRRQAIDIAFERWQDLCPQEEHDAVRAQLRRVRRVQTARARKAAARASPVT